MRHTVTTNDRHQCMFTTKFTVTDTVSRAKKILRICAVASSLNHNKDRNSDLVCIHKQNLKLYSMIHCANHYYLPIHNIGYIYWPQRLHCSNFYTLSYSCPTIRSFRHHYDYLIQSKKVTKSEIPSWSSHIFLLRHCWTSPMLHLPQFRRNLWHLTIVVSF